MADLARLATEKNFGTRADVFALLPPESQFRAAQTAARLVVQAGGFQPLLGQIQLDPPPPVIEPLPVWRLAGVVLGDGVVALLDTGEGRVYDVRPGSRVPGTPWTVVAIDSERAVLRREGNRLPREFIVYLSGPIRLPTQAAPGGGQPGQQGQQPGAGQQGAGGRPGGTPQT